LKWQFCGLRAAKSGGLSLAVASMEVYPRGEHEATMSRELPPSWLDLKQAEQIAS
jgi:hypothetical protein